MSKEIIPPDKEIFETFGQGLEKARNIRGLTQGEFARKADLHQSQVSRWENTDSIPVKNTRKKISQVLNFDITRVEKGWIIRDLDNRLEEPAMRFRLAEKEIDSNQEPKLDDLPRLIRLRDKLDEKIQKLVKRKSHD